MTVTPTDTGAAKRAFLGYLFLMAVVAAIGAFWIEPKFHADNAVDTRWGEKASMVLACGAMCALTAFIALVNAMLAFSGKKTFDVNVPKDWQGAIIGLVLLGVGVAIGAWIFI